METHNLDTKTDDRLFTVLNLKLPPGMVENIDRARGSQGQNLNRSAWIRGAIVEKLERARVTV